MTDQHEFRRSDDTHASVAALASADQAQAAVRWGSRWVARYLYAWGCGTLIFLPLTGLQRGQSVLVSTLWSAFVVGTFVYARHQRVVPAGATRLYLLSIAGWSFLWAGTLVLGLGAFRGNAGFWIPAGAVVSIPPFVAARTVRR